MSLGLGFIEILIILAVVWAIAHVYYKYPAKTQPSQHKPLSDKLGYELGKMSRNTSDTLLGEHGRAWQVVGFAALLILVWFWGRDFMPARPLYVAVFVIGIIYFFRSFRNSDANSKPSASAPPVPPPLPPHARGPAPEDRDRSEFVSVRPSGFGLFRLLSVFTLFLLAAGAVIFVLRLGGLYVVMRRLGDVALVQQLESVEDFDAVKIVSGQQIAAQPQAAVPYQRPPQSPDVLIPVTPTPATPMPPTLPAAPFAPGQVAPYVPRTIPPQAVIPPTDSHDEPSVRKNESGFAIVALTTDPFPTESEASNSALAMASQYAAKTLAQSGMAFTQWQPSLQWTRRSFIEDIRVEKVQRGDVTVFIGHADVRVPDEKKIQQIWSEYVRDQASGRSLLLLKIFGGAVFLIGGIAILLRLGTGRHLTNEPVSLKKRWLGRKQPAKG